MHRSLQLFVGMLIVSTGFGALQSNAADTQNQTNHANVSESRQTPFGLYYTPKEAFAALTQDPSIVLIDVRDPMEVSFIGHPEPMDANVPLRMITRSFVPDSGSYEMEPNKNFVANVDAMISRLGFTKDQPIIVSCRSGPRSAAAARLLHKAGYKMVWNQIEGFEGSTDPATGSRNLNGWRNAGLPWKNKISKNAYWRF